MYEWAPSQTLGLWCCLGFSTTTAVLRGRQGPWRARRRAGEGWKSAISESRVISRNVISRNRKAFYKLFLESQEWGCRVIPLVPRNDLTLSPVMCALENCDSSPRERPFWQGSRQRYAKFQKQKWSFVWSRNTAVILLRVLGCFFFKWSGKRWEECQEIPFKIMIKKKNLSLKWVIFRI